MPRTIKITLVVFFVFLSMGILVFLWWNNWLRPTAVTVLQDTFAKANAGEYDQAIQNFPTVERDFFAKDPALTKLVFSSLTKQGSISQIVINEVIAEDNKTTVFFEIKYKDETSCFSWEDVFFIQQDGKWKHSILNTYKKMEPIKVPENFKNLRLMEEYTQIPNTNIFLRLPESCTWLKNYQAFRHAQFEMFIVGTLLPGDGPEAALAMLEEHWENPQYKLKVRKEVNVGKLKGNIYEGQQTTNQGRIGRGVTLIFGDNKNHAFVRIFCPDDEKVAQVARECLLTAKWNEEMWKNPKDLYPYTIKPAQGLKFAGIVFQGFVSFFSESGDPLFLVKPDEANFEVGMGGLEYPFQKGQQDRNNWFKDWLKSRPKLLSEISTEFVHPLTVDSLEGFEGGSVILNTIINQKSFEYRAVLVSGFDQGYIFTGYCSLPAREQFEPKFKQMVRSFQQK